MNTILTPEDIERHIGYRLPAEAMNLLLGLIAERESAVLAKLREQQPVAMVDGQWNSLHIRFLPSGWSLEKGDQLYAAPQPAVVQVPQADWAADAREWGSALNDAGWEFDEAYRRHMGEPVSAKLFNTCKTIIRDVILRYAEKVSAAAESPNKEQR